MTVLNTCSKALSQEKRRPPAMATFRTIQAISKPQIAHDLGCSLQEDHLKQGSRYVTTLWREGNFITFVIDESASKFQPIVRLATTLHYVVRLDLQTSPTIH